MIKYENKELENLLLKKRKTAGELAKQKKELVPLQCKLWDEFFHTVYERYGKYVQHCSCFNTGIKAFHKGIPFVPYAVYYVAFMPRSETEFEIGLVPRKFFKKDGLYNKFDAIGIAYADNDKGNAIEIFPFSDFNKTLKRKKYHFSKFDFRYYDGFSKYDLWEWMMKVIRELNKDFEKVMQSIESSIEAQLQMNIKKNMYEIKKLE